MAAPNQGITYAELVAALSYDSATGELTWKVVPKSFRVNVGDRAGWKSRQGYIRVSVGGQAYPAHRLAWFMAHGVWPSGTIDHINGNRADNRLANLRDVSSAVNNQNRRRAQRNNSSSGVLGVTKHRNVWQAQLQVDGKKVYLDKYKTVDLAQAAYKEAKRTLHQGCTI